MAKTDAADLAALFDRILWSLRTITPRPESATALSVLDTLDREGPLRISDLVTREHISQPGMTQLACRLEHSGLVRRLGDPVDRRATVVEITRDGRNVLHEFRTQRASALARALAALSPAHRAQLRAAHPALAALRCALAVSVRGESSEAAGWHEPARTPGHQAPSGGRTRGAALRRRSSSSPDRERRMRAAKR
ncbi:transcriptional regulator, MarR family [Acidothermus cellulolyticus 11B]|uniref:Transcriptional regulator, MarR family n=1 Tax=Acidothermus cellulolyticus (strain ATCC 43068 / DSM 8971 / 11B) TaxID=351607 RepID=A0LQW0_ACIC1|nr:MarR family transcriptional regulator [Acidothermus cellulolyticus]ABK51820.1 transcriptional regulator, MarR family [Acidothermus cellulolyticus 11B]